MNLNASRRAIGALTVALGIFGALEAGAQSWPALDQALEGGEGQASQDAALLVGIEDYAFAPDVPGAIANISAWYMHLRKARGLPLDHIKLLRDGQATREEILAGLSGAIEKLGPEGTLWVIFVGHGAPTSEGDGVLVGADAQISPRSAEARGVRRGELLAAIGAGPQARAVVLLDACFSGLDREGRALAEGIQPLVPVSPMLAPGRALILTAARNDQFAGDLPGAGRPAFSYLMLGALRGWADADADGAVTAAEAHDYTRRVMEVLVTDRDQEPQAFGDARGVILSRGAREAGPDLDAMRLAAAATRPRRDEGEAQVAPRAEPQGFNTLVRIEAKQDGEVFQALVLSGDGKQLPCPADVTYDNPCVIRGVAPGTARIRVKGDVNETREIPVPIGATSVEIDALPTWTIVTGGVLMGVGMLSSMGLFIAGASCDEAVDSSCQSVFLATAGASFFVVGGSGVALLAYGLAVGRETDFEDITVHSISGAGAALDGGEPGRPWALGLAPIQGGALLQLGLSWP